MTHWMMLAALALAQPAPPAVPEIGLPPNELKAVFLKTLAIEEFYDWSVQSLNAEAAHAAGITGKGVTVAVLDTGVDADHPDLKGAVKERRDFTRSRTGVTDVQGHGTHCAGSIGARKNGDGIVGVAPDCEILGYKVLSDSGSGAVDGIAAGIDAATKAGAAVISMSLGGDSADGYIPPALARAEAEGVIVLAAAGNDGRTGVSFPGGYADALCVAAVDASLKRARFSNAGPEVIVAGPGVNVRSTYPGGRYATMSGTSMATPNIAGVAALWVQANPALAKQERPSAFRKWLSANCKDLPPNGRDAGTGYGYPDCSRLALVPALPPPTAPVVPEPYPVDLTFSEADLTGAAKAKLRAAGLAAFRVVLTPAKLTPAPKTVEVPPPDRIPPQSLPTYAAPAGDGWKWVVDHWERTLAETGPGTIGSRPVVFPLRPLVPQSSCPGGNCPR